MKAALAAVALALYACTPSTQLAQLCDAEGGRCTFADGLPRLGQYSRSTGAIQIDRAQCDADWPLCEWAIYHELGHARGFTSERDANCFALQRASMPARRAAERTLGAGWETQCE